jgi:acyl-CoA synthetase (NDP forming)
MSSHPLEEILHPKTIAVVGASGGGRGGQFVEPLLEFGYKGKIYPVNPKYSEILGMKAYPTLRDIPGAVDFVISVVPAREVLKMMEDAAQKGVKGIHLFTARFSETGRRQAAELEQEVLRLAKRYGIRLIGPNCMGVYYPAEGISFQDEFPKQSGPVALVSQSGNVAGEIIHNAGRRGIYFSKAISYGNAIDLNECDYLEYFAQDPETKIILMYIEGAKDGKRFFDVLRRTAPIKPVIVIKGGKGQAGARATASHTASLAGSLQIWEAMVAQAGAISVETLDELIDLAVSFRFLPPIRGKRVGVAGGAGGASVLAADECEIAGLEVIPLPPEFREEMKNRGISIWDWLSNPADLSIRENDDFSVGTALEMMAKNPNFDLLIAIMGHMHRHFMGADITIDKYLQEQYSLNACRIKPLLAVVPDASLGINEWDSWEWKMNCELRTRLIEENVPFYTSIPQAANAARKMIDYYPRQS